MVKVRDVKTETELRRELAQKEQERDGVGAAGDRDDDGSGRQEVVLTHEREDGRADRSSGRQRWLGWESDPRPGGYESPALTPELPSPRRQLYRGFPFHSAASHSRNSPSDLAALPMLDD